MRQQVILFKRGTDSAYWICDCCSHAVQTLSPRGWCAACEFECTRVGKQVREKLEKMKAEGFGAQE
jgi:hypothetical protein